MICILFQALDLAVLSMVIFLAISPVKKKRQQLTNTTYCYLNRQQNLQLPFNGGEEGLKVFRRQTKGPSPKLKLVVIKRLLCNKSFRL